MGLKDSWKRTRLNDKTVHKIQWVLGCLGVIILILALIVFLVILLFGVC